VRFAAAATGAVLLAACAAVPPAPPPVATVFVDAPFAIEGRLSARRGSDAVAASFTWRHAPPLDDIVLTTPLGQAVAEISGDASTRRYELRGADGRREDASDWNTLTERALGAPIPVSGLAAWIVAAPRPGAPHSIEGDAAGRVGVLRQDGWEIVYAYADERARLPVGLRLTQADAEVRIAVQSRN
jgi:outer membrane lipoprotein LolB